VRWLVIALLLVAARADAIVIEEPGMYYACPKGKTWDEVAKCLRSQGRFEIKKTLTGAKLLFLEQKEGDVWVDAGLYLYTETKAGWQIAGMFQGRGTDYELMDFKTMSVGKHNGYRIDLGQATPLYVQLDGLTTQSALRRSQHAMFCGGQYNTCTFVTTWCEVLVRGQAYWAFRGAMTIAGNAVPIAGDRQYAGPFCSQAERVFLGWPDG